MLRYLLMVTKKKTAATLSRKQILYLKMGTALDAAIAIIFAVLYYSAEKWPALAWAAILSALFIASLLAREKTKKNYTSRYVFSIFRFITSRFGTCMLCLIPIFLMSGQGLLYIGGVLVIIAIIVLIRYWDDMQAWWYTR